MKFLIPFAMFVALSLVAAREAGAVGFCSAVCGPASPCKLKCNNGTQQHPSVTTCDQVGPCRRTFAPAFSLQLESAPGACASTLAVSPLRLPLLAWLHNAAPWISAAADRLALLAEPSSAPQRS